MRVAMKTSPTALEMKKEERQTNHVVGHLKKIQTGGSS